MNDDGDEFSELDDPAFLAERTRVHAELEKLAERYRKLDEEFDRRARAAWIRAS